MSTFADDEAGPERIDLEDESPEALQALFDERGWGDGLPLVAPTEARVAAMLGGRDPDEEVAVLPPRFGRATRQALAVNAVLAGCSPELFPVVTTAIRALSGPDVNLQGVQATTHPVAPLVIVHGEAVADLAFNAGLGTLGPGRARTRPWDARSGWRCCTSAAGTPGEETNPPRGSRPSTRTASPRTHRRARGRPIIAGPVWMRRVP